MGRAQDAKPLGILQLKVALEVPPVRLPRAMQVEPSGLSIQGEIPFALPAQLSRRLPLPSPYRPQPLPQAELVQHVDDEPAAGPKQSSGIGCEGGEVGGRAQPGEAGDDAVQALRGKGPDLRQRHHSCLGQMSQASLRCLLSELLHHSLGEVDTRYVNAAPGQEEGVHSGATADVQHPVARRNVRT